MRKKRNVIRDEEENEINLTPMLDVVFIMLIFFIVTATFIKRRALTSIALRRYWLTRSKMPPF
jgi:biopolymer transport protein ExbD